MFTSGKAQASKNVEVSRSYLDRIENADLSAKQIYHDTNTMIRNIIHGYCPIELEKVYIFVQNTKQITDKGAVKLLCNYDTPAMLEGTSPIITADAILLMRVCTGLDYGVVGKAMGADLRRIKEDSADPRMDRAVPAIVRAAVRRGLCSDSDAERLTKKFKSWLHGVNWVDCENKVRPNHLNNMFSPLILFAYGSCLCLCLL